MKKAAAVASCGALLSLMPTGCRFFERTAVDLFGPPRVQPQEVFDRSGGSADFRVWSGLLSRVVDPAGRVDYGRLRASETATLTRVLEGLAELELDRLGRDHRLAALINAYNAFTLQLILDHWPVDSIQKIPRKDRWDAVRWNLGGTKVSLTQIEHQMLRRQFVEPRIHFAINCASEGCPPLRAQAYEGERIEAQLAAVTRHVHDPSKRWLDLEFDRASNRVRVDLTRIYLWYEDDFTRDAGLLDFVRRWTPELDEALEAGARAQVGYLDYDWSLNRSAASAPRSGEP